MIIKVRYISETIRIITVIFTCEQLAIVFWYVFGTKRSSNIYIYIYTIASACVRI